MDVGEGDGLPGVEGSVESVGSVGDVGLGQTEALTGGPAAANSDLFPFSLVVKLVQDDSAGVAAAHGHVFQISGDNFFHVCGRAKVVGLPYCEAHARRAFQPPQVRRRERDGTETVRVVVPPKVPVRA